MDTHIQLVACETLQACEDLHKTLASAAVLRHYSTWYRCTLGRLGPLLTSLEVRAVAQHLSWALEQCLVDSEQRSDHLRKNDNIVQASRLVVHTPEHLLCIRNSGGRTEHRSEPLCRVGRVYNDGNCSTAQFLLFVAIAYAVQQQYVAFVWGLGPHATTAAVDAQRMSLVLVIL
jgi:hypothetical protein